MTTQILSPITEVHEETGRVESLEWWMYVDAIVCPEDDGGFSVFAIHYPGVISEGDTLEEAMENIREAFVAMREAMQDQGEEMNYSKAPWITKDDSVRLRIKVNA